MQKSSPRDRPGSGGGGGRFGASTLSDPESPFEASPKPTEDQLVRQEYERLRKMDPIKAAEYMADHQIAKENHLAKKQAEQSLRDRETAERNHSRYMEAQQRAADDTAQLRRDAMALSNTKIVRDRRDFGTKLHNVLLAAVGGLVSARTGGPNVGLQMVMKGLDEDVEIQKGELANKQQALGMRRNFIADEMSRGADIYKAEETYRHAVLEGYKADLQAEAMKFDPKGTQAIKRYQMIQQVELAQRTATDAYNKKRLDERLMMAKIHETEADAALKMSKVKGIGAGGVATPKADDVVQLPNYYKDRGLLPPPVAMSAKDYDKWQKQKKGSVEIEKEQTEAGQKVAERRLGAKGQFIQDDGKTEWSAPAGDEGKKFRKQKGALDALAQMRNEIHRGIAEHGGESDFFKSEAWQRQKSRHTFIQGLVKEALELGALDKGSLQFAKDLSGDVDPTSFWRDARPGLDQLVDNMTSKLNHDMGAADYTGKPYKPPHAGNLPPPKADAVDAAYKKAKTSKYGQTIEEGDPSGFDIIDTLSEYGAGRPAVGIKRDYHSNKDEKPTKDSLDALYRGATTGKPDERKKAIAYLKSIYDEEGPTDVVKDLAGQYYRAALIANASKGGK